MEQNNNLNISSSNIRSNSKSPVIVLTNADYKRPSSILSSRSADSNASKSAEADTFLMVDWWGTLMLACHFFIGLLLLLGSLFDFIWNSISLVKQSVRPLKEIPAWTIFALSFEIFLSILVSLKTSTKVLFGGKESFIKNYRYKTHKIFLYATFGIILGAIICLSIHCVIYFKSQSTKLTPYLAAGVFLFLHGLMNIRLYCELEDGGDSGDTMMLPFRAISEEEEAEEMSEISAV